MRSAFAFLLSIAFHLLALGVVVLGGGIDVDLPGAWQWRERSATSPGDTRLSEPAASTSPASPAAASGPVQAPVPPQAGRQASAPAPDVPKIGFTDFGDWRYGCTPATSGKPSVCSISQRLIDTGSQTPLLIWQILQDGSGGVVSLIRTPRDISFDRGLVLVLTPGTEHRLPVSACFTSGCVARTDLAPEFRQALSAAKQIAVMVFSVEQKAVRFAVSTRGLAEGLAALQR